MKGIIRSFNTTESNGKFYLEGFYSQGGGAGGESGEGIKKDVISVKKSILKRNTVSKLRSLM